jgi:anaerobic selenocysteine-containing dehydrogenase
VYNANPAVTAPNSNLVVDGLRREDLFTVVHEQFMTDTARYADIVLPATGMLEHLDLLYPWGHATVVLNRPAIEPPGECVSNNELFRRLARALGRDEPQLQVSEEDLIRGVLAGGHPWMVGVTYERLWEEGWAPIGMPADWKPYAEGNFRTESGRCELAAEPLPDHVPPAPDPRHPLTLVSAKLGVHFLNSSYSHLPRHAGAEGEPAIHLHEVDAAARGIADGTPVRVRNALVARLDGVARPGVVAVAFGYWRRAGNPGANALTSDGLSDGGGGGDFYSTRVEVEVLS